MKVDYTVIVPAYNEEHWLPQTLRALRQAMSEQTLSGEVVVVDNNSSDRTAEIATAGGASVVFESVNQISRARNAGAAMATGRFLLFVDADTVVSSALLGEALKNMQDGGCCGGGARVAFDHLPSHAARIGLNLWNWLSLNMQLAAGCFVYATKEAYDAVGGFSEQVYASEEIWFSRGLKRWGKANGQRFCIIDNHSALSSGRKLEWFGPWQQTGLLLLMIFFPAFVRFKRLCGFWYKRPMR